MATSRCNGVIASRIANRTRILCPSRTLVERIIFTEIFVTSGHLFAPLLLHEKNRSRRSRQNIWAEVIGAAVVFSVILIFLYGVNLQIEQGSRHALFFDCCTDFCTEFFRRLIHDRGVVLGGNIYCSWGAAHSAVKDFICCHDTHAAGLLHIFGKTYQDVDHAVGMS